MSTLSPEHRQASRAAKRFEFTARVRVAILNEGLAEKKYILSECVDPENDEWVVEIDDDE
jgi:hypothetical protein